MSNEKYDGSRLLLIVNPKSGKMKMQNNLLSVVNIFSEAGYTVTVYPTKCRLDATEYAKIHAKEYDTIVCCGGDGTLNEVITGIMHSGADSKIGYIPSGTLNEWSSGLKISRNIATAAKDIVTGELSPLDIGSFDDKFFSYTASFGAFTEASYSAPQEVKNILGQLAYLFEGIKSLGNIKPISMTFEVDGKIIEGEFLFGAISNSLSVGGIVKYDKKSVTLNDGLFEVMLIHNPKNPIQLQSLISAVLTQNYDNPYIEFYPAKEIKVTNCEGVAWTLDGEKAVSSKELIIKNLHNAIKFYLPKK